MQSQAISLPSKTGSVAEIQNALRPYDMIQEMIIPVHVQTAQSAVLRLESRV